MSIDLFKNSTDFEVYPAGKTIFSEGEPGKNMYVVIDGEVDIFVHGTPVESVGVGGIIGELALIDGHVRSGSAVAKVDSKLVPVDQRRFTFMIQQTPFFAIQVMHILADRIRQIDNYIPRK